MKIRTFGTVAIIRYAFSSCGYIALTATSWVGKEPCLSKRIFDLRWRGDQNKNPRGMMINGIGETLSSVTVDLMFLPQPLSCQVSQLTWCFYHNLPQPLSCQVSQLTWCFYHNLYPVKCHSWPDVFTTTSTLSVSQLTWCFYHHLSVTVDLMFLPQLLSCQCHSWPDVFTTTSILSVSQLTWCFYHNLYPVSVTVDLMSTTASLMFFPWTT